MFSDKHTVPNKSGWNQLTLYFSETSTPTYQNTIRQFEEHITNPQCRILHIMSITRCQMNERNPEKAYFEVRIWDNRFHSVAQKGVSPHTYIHTNCSKFFYHIKIILQSCICSIHHARTYTHDLMSHFFCVSSHKAITTSCYTNWYHLRTMSWKECGRRRSWLYGETVRPFAWRNREILSAASVTISDVTNETRTGHPPDHKSSALPLNQPGWYADTHRALQQLRSHFRTSV